MAPAAWGASDFSENVGVMLLAQSSSDNDKVSEASRSSSGWSVDFTAALEDQLLKLSLPVVLL